MFLIKSKMSYKNKAMNKQTYEMNSYTLFSDVFANPIEAMKRVTIPKSVIKILLPSVIGSL